MVQHGFATAFPVVPADILSSTCLPDAGRSNRGRRIRSRGQIRAVRAMIVIWGLILVGGITFFAIVGLSHG